MYLYISKESLGFTLFSTEILNVLFIHVLKIFSKTCIQCEVLKFLLPCTDVCGTAFFTEILS